MTIRDILKMGDPRLLRVAEPVRDFDTPELHALVADMFETMHAVNGAGLPIGAACSSADGPGRFGAGSVSSVVDDECRDERHCWNQARPTAAATNAATTITGCRLRRERPALPPPGAAAFRPGSLRRSLRTRRAEPVGSRVGSGWLRRPSGRSVVPHRLPSK